MKKNILMGTVVCCLSLAPVTGVAQTVETDDYIIRFQRSQITFTVCDDMFRETLYFGEGLRAGRVKFQTGVYGKMKRKGKIVIENPYIETRLTDAYGREVAYDVDSTVLHTISMESIGLKPDGKFVEDHDYAPLILRGGEYNLHWDYPCFDIHGDSTIVLKDDPSVRERFGKMMTIVGHDIKLTTVYNTGYPFDMTQFSGIEQAKITLFSFTPDEQGNAVLNELTSASKTLDLYRPEEPKMAAIDSLELTYEKPQPGAYLLRMSSDCQLPNANRDFTFSVNDTLRANVTPTQTTYKVAVEPALRYHLTMNYGYPYIQPSGNDEVPAVYIITNILKPQEENWMEPDTLMSGVSKIEGAELAKQTLDWEGDIEVKGLETQEIAPAAETDLVAEVVIFFNDKVQYRTYIPFTYIPSTVGIRSAETKAGANANAAWYDLQGRSLKGRPVSKGIYVHNGVKIVNQY